MPGRRTELPSVYEYLDVRTYLRDLYAAKKVQGRGFSYRAFSRRAGLSSPNHLKRVIDGERRLTPPMALTYAEAIGLDPRETEYFQAMAEFSSAQTTAKRAEAFQRLAGFRQVQREHRLEFAHAAYHSRWYLPAIRELVLHPEFQEDPAWIAPRMLPPIRQAEAAEALDILFELGLLDRDEDGRVIQGDAVLSTGPETGMYVASYHRAMLERASEAIDLVHRDDRDISSITFAGDDATLHEIKGRIQRFRKELVAIAAAAPPGDRVIQLNFQLFPLTARPSEESR